jgi:DNA polymerase III sliding clamp (beta) subunit (PCNA family)
MVAATYEEGAPHENVAVMDRKVLFGSLKAVGPNVEITLFREKMVNLTGAEGRQVGMTAKQGRGSSSIRFSADLMTDILSAMAGKEVIVAWKDDARKPLMIRDSGKQGHVFLLAPVSKIA